MSELDLDLEEEEKLEEKLEEEETGQKEEEEGHALDAETGQTNQASTSRETGTSHDNSKGRETGTKGSITNDAMCENENQNTTTEREMAQLQFILDCSSGLLEKVEKALHEDALIEIDVNSLDDQGTPALNYAVMLGHVEICKVLLDKGALPTVKDKKGRDARKWASRSSNQEIKDLVLLNGSYSAHSTPVSSRPNSLLPLEPVSATTTATTTTAATDPTAITITNTTKRQKEQPPTIPSSTIKTITSSPQRSLSIAAETTDSFDWNQGKPSEMCPFDPDDSAHILNVAIRTIVPSRKSKFQPLGANVLFLCARYACYHTSVELANIFLNGAVRVIRLWVKENSLDSNDSTSTPTTTNLDSSFPASTSFSTSSCRLYWLSNSLQLLVYLKRDGRLIVDTIEPQMELSLLIQELLEGVNMDLFNQLSNLVGPALIEYAADESKLELDFFGFAKRKTFLQPARRRGSGSSGGGGGLSLFESLQDPDRLVSLYAEGSSTLSSLTKAATASSPPDNIKPSTLFPLFSSLYAACRTSGLSTSLTTQICTKFTSHLSTLLLYKLVKNRTLCSRSRAQQLQINLCEIGDWIRESQIVNFDEAGLAGLVEALGPVMQVLQFLQVVSTCSQVSAFTSLHDSFSFVSYELMHHVMLQYRFEKGEASFPEVVQTFLQAKIDGTFSGTTSAATHTTSQYFDNQDSFASSKRLTPSMIVNAVEKRMDMDGGAASGSWKIGAREEGDTAYWNTTPSIPRVVLELINQTPGL